MIAPFRTPKACMDAGFPSLVTAQYGMIPGMARSSKRQHRLSDGYSFPGFEAQAAIRGVFGDPGVRIVTLVRRSKKTACGDCGLVTVGWYDRRVRHARDLPAAEFRIVLEFDARRVACLAAR